MPGLLVSVAVSAGDVVTSGQVVAVLELMAGAHPPTLEAARAAVKDLLPPWCAPRAVHVVAALPRTASGKVQRGAVRGMLGPAAGAGGLTSG